MCVSSHKHPRLVSQIYLVLDWGACKCVCLTRMSSFSELKIEVLDWGAYKCVCVCVCLNNVHVHYAVIHTISKSAGSNPAVAKVT